MQTCPEPSVTDVLRRTLRLGDTFIDVGANAGVHTVEGARLVGPAGRVLAIEPGENILPELRHAVAGLPQVEIIGQPVSNRQGPVDFFLCADGTGGNALWDPAAWPTNEKTRATADRCRPMQATTLDRLLASRGLSPRVIKIDTEGAEQRILEGLATMLSERPPEFIVAELHEFGLKKMGCSQWSLRAFMTQRDYSTFVLCRDGLRPVQFAPNAEIPSRFILNLLFAIPSTVEALWAG
jgi:FkbM family methyltransferase